jgi:hypothetical protein
LTSLAIITGPTSPSALNLVAVQQDNNIYGINQQGQVAWAIAQVVLPVRMWPGMTLNTIVNGVLLVASPDGLWSVNLATGALVDAHSFALCELGSATPRQVSYSRGVQAVSVVTTDGCAYDVTVNSVTGIIVSTKISQGNPIMYVTRLPLYIVVTRFDSVVEVYSASQHTLLWTYTPLVPTTIWSPLWQENGRFLATTTDTSTISVFDGATGALVVALSLPQQNQLRNEQWVSRIIDDIMIVFTNENVMAFDVSPYIGNQTSATARMKWSGTRSHYGTSYSNFQVYTDVNRARLIIYDVSNPTNAWMSAVDIHTGAINWTIRSDVGSIPPTFQDDVVVFPSPPGPQLYDLATGQPVVTVVNTQVAVWNAALLIGTGATQRFVTATNDTTTQTTPALYITVTAVNVAPAPPPVPTLPVPQSSLAPGNTLPPATAPTTLPPNEQLPSLGCLGAVQVGVPAFVTCVNQNIISLLLPNTQIPCDQLSFVFQQCVVSYTDAMIQTNCGSGVNFLTNHLLPSANSTASLPLCRPLGGSMCAAGTNFCLALAAPANASLATPQNLPSWYSIYSPPCHPTVCPAASAADDERSHRHFDTTATRSDGHPHAAPWTDRHAHTNAPRATNTPTPPPSPTDPTPPPPPMSPPLVAAFPGTTVLPSATLLQSDISTALYNGRQSVMVVVLSQHPAAPVSLTFAFLGDNADNVFNEAKSYGLDKLAAAIGATSIEPALQPTPPAPKKSHATVIALSIVISLLVVGGAGVAAFLYLRTRRQSRRVERDLLLNAGRVDSNADGNELGSVAARKERVSLVA